MWQNDPIYDTIVSIVVVFIIYSLLQDTEYKFHLNYYKSYIIKFESDSIFLCYTDCSVIIGLVPLWSNPGSAPKQAIRFRFRFQGKKSS
jgi:hypothetical protein